MNTTEYIVNNILNESDFFDQEIAKVYSTLEHMNRHDIMRLLRDIIHVEENSSQSDPIEILHAIVNNYDELLVHLDETGWWNK